MAITALTSRTCRDCGRGLTDGISLRYRLGSDCRKDKTDEELRAALEQTRAERDPAYIPPAKAPTATAHQTNAAARAVADQAQRPDICPDHGGIVEACAGCRHEQAYPAARIIALVQAQSHDERRAERVAALTRRYAHIAPWRPDPTLRPRRRTTAPTGPVQLEIA
jgi:hypothetical protein